MSIDLLVELMRHFIANHKDAKEINERFLYLSNKFSESSETMELLEHEYESVEYLTTKLLDFKGKMPQKKYIKFIRLLSDYKDKILDSLVNLIVKRHILNIEKIHGGYNMFAFWNLVDYIEAVDISPIKNNTRKQVLKLLTKISDRVSDPSERKRILNAIMTVGNYKII
jgi:hypothetical protein